jgi:argininosuccinate lyase
LTEWQQFSDQFGDDLSCFLAPEDAVDDKDLPGGTATGQVRTQISRTLDFLSREVG